MRRPLIPVIFGVAKYNPIKALGSDLIAWWDADPQYWGTNGNITVATGVSNWADIIAGYPVTQATGSTQPVWSPTSFNGGYGVSFDGIDDNLTSTNAGLLAALPNSSTSSEILALSEQDALAADATDRVCFAYGGPNASRDVRRTVVTGVNRGRMVTGTGAGTTNLTGSVVDLSGRNVVRGQFNAASQAQTIDGTADGTSAASMSTTNTRVRIGAYVASSAASFWQGPVATIMVTKPLSASEATGLQSWLMSRRRP